MRPEDQQDDEQGEHDDDDPEGEAVAVFRHGPNLRRAVGHGKAMRTLKPDTAVGRPRPGAPDSVGEALDTPTGDGRFRQSKGSLSMRRVGPNRTASDSSAGRVDAVELRERRPVGDETYSGSASGSRGQDRRHRARSASAGSLAGRPSVARAASSARRRTGAAARSAGERWTFRDEIARPSGSRTVGQAMTSVGDREVAGHLPDHHHLLGVLLAEVGALGADQVEQDRDDRRDAVEVAGPGGALERPGDARRPTTIVSKPGG